MPEIDYHNALGLLAPLYEDPAVLEIMVDSPTEVLVERSGKLEPAGVSFASPEALLQTIQDLLAACQARRRPGQTIADLRLGQEARLLVVFPPTAPAGPCLVIRKLFLPKLTWEQLVAFGAVTPDALEALRSAVQTGGSLLVAGGTGAGKTTLANLLAELIPAEQRIVIVEAFHELEVRLTAPQPRLVRLEAGSQDETPYPELIRTAARMRPDWLLVGELTGAEAMSAVEVLGRGHSGLTTIHASSAEDALARLESFCLMANLGLGLGEIRAWIASAFRVLTYQRRLASGARKLTDIIEICGVEDGRYLLQPLFRFSIESNRLEATGIQPSWLID